MTTRARLTVYAALATAMSTLCLSPLVTPAGWLLVALLLVLVNALAGAGLRRLGAARPMVIVGQLLLALWLAMVLSISDHMLLGVIPMPDTVRTIGDLLGSAGTEIQAYSIPAPASTGLSLLLTASVALIAVVVDALAVTYRRAALAGLPLLALYSVGTGLAGDSGSPVLWFMLSAGGYLMLLFAEGRDRLSRWGRVFRGAGSGPERNGTALSTGGHQIGLVALVVALLLPFLAPNWDLSLVGGGVDASGSGGRGGNINALNPVVSLTDGLRQPDNQPLITYRGSSPDLATAYLRITALDDFTGVEWKPGEQPAQAVPSELPTPEGLGGLVSTGSMDTQIAISPKLGSEWLPAPYPMMKSTVSGDWRYEPQTRSLIGDRGQHAGGLSYTVTSLDLKPTADELRAAAAPPAAIMATDLGLPDNLPPVVKQTALQVTQGRPTAYDKAVALQDWFAQSGGFVYSSSIDPGTGPDAIAKFLQDKKGFCVHFAATMAAMARTLGIPARVAVGFAPGADQGGGTYVVGSKDYHAWPELYFQGAGWLRFEPTPSRGSAPAYTSDQPAPTMSPTADQPSASAHSAPTSVPSAQAGCPAQLRKLGQCPESKAPTAVATTQSSSAASPQLLALLAGAALVLLLLLSPMVWRARLRRRRLGRGGRRRAGADSAALTREQVLAAWSELIDSAWDLGIPPDDARSPRHTMRRLTEQGSLDEKAQAAVGRVALAAERVLYAREVGQPAPLGPDVRTVRESLRSAAGRGRRVRALLLPPSAARLVWRAGDRLLAARLRGRAVLARAAAARGRLAARLRPVRRSAKPADGE
ncbi:transglutaminase-like putative cysteine protease [Kitasatospora sp. MAP12-15]|uniref:transglutaminase family protein n=1 Tax=unclassified Kitasatospora TaxID=2633591 RepID=UPI002475F8AA|nr:DUF3488 and transglutaminase-like domain-containing protein [Kitasatospora sp. MAP12-44]MDH6110015.1 transglutaminase-like putative cysteine protease [Kitasatospora sp. MAP12-44]